MRHEPEERLFEDFVVGDVFVHRGRRVATEADRVWFAALTMNGHEMHVGAAERGVLPVAWTVAVVLGLTVDDLSRAATANLRWSDVSFPTPVRVGDEVRAESEVLAVDPDAAGVTFATTGLNADGEIVVELERTVALRRRSEREVGVDE
jgi:itaconyl-CoA hydratase